MVFGWSCPCAGCTGSRVASLDPFSCQTRMVSPVDGSVFLCNFGSAIALETPRKRHCARAFFSPSSECYVQKAIVRIRCSLTWRFWRQLNCEYSATFHKKYFFGAWFGTKVSEKRLSLHPKNCCLRCAGLQQLVSRYSSEGWGSAIISVSYLPSGRGFCHYLWHLQWY